MQNKKLFSAVVFLLLFTSVVQNAAAYGYRSSRIGFGLGTPNAVFIYQPSPFDFRVGYDFTDGNQFVFFSGDWRPVGHIPITGPLYFYFGLGAYAKLYPESGSDSFFQWGTRLPLGLSLLFLDNIVELFVEIAPGFDLYPKPAFSGDPVQVWAGLNFAMR